MGIVVFGRCYKCNLRLLKAQHQKELSTNPQPNPQKGITYNGMPLDTDVYFKVDGSGTMPMPPQFWTDKPYQLNSNLPVPPEVIEFNLNGETQMTWKLKRDNTTGELFYEDQMGNRWKYNGLPPTQ